MIMEVESVTLGPLRFATFDTGEIGVTIRNGAAGTVLLNARQVAELRQLLKRGTDE
jgi:hypothetical protein